MITDIDKSIQQTKQYWYLDGLSELGMAALFAAVAGVFALESLAPEGSIWAISSACTLPLVVIGGSWLVTWVVQRAKGRITYPRTGFVVYRRPTRRHRLLGAAVAAVVGSVVAILAVTGAIVPTSMQWVPFVTASIIGLILLLIGASVGVARYYALAVASVAIGALAARTFPDPTQGSAVLFGAMAVVLALSGTLVLVRYLRTSDPIHDASATSEIQ